MRGLVFALLAVNIGFAIWGGLKYGYSRDVGAMNADVGIGLRTMPGANLIMLSEYSSSGQGSISVPTAPVVARSESNAPLQDIQQNAPADSSVSVAEDKSNVAFCVLLGPLQDPVQAQVLITRLAAMEIVGKYGSVEMAGGQDYWVYLKPEANRDLASAKLRELQEKKIDSFIIPQGELANGISLGIFDKEENANSRRQELIDRGYEALVQVSQRKYQEGWVVLYPDEALKFSNELYSVLHMENNRLDYRKELCAKVASLGDIQ